MQAVILAAGAGQRLGGTTNGKPKCLLEIGGAPLIEHQLDALASYGVRDVLLVVGFGADAVRSVVGARAEYVVNARYLATNSLYSFWLARYWIHGPFVLLNSDVLFHPEIMGRLLAADGNTLAFDSTAVLGREETKVIVRNQRVLDLGKALPACIAQGESLGVLRFDAAGAQTLLAGATSLLAGGQETHWVTEAVRACCLSMRLHAVNVAGVPWIEVDFPADLEQARCAIWPAIEQSVSNTLNTRRWPASPSALWQVVHDA